MAAMSAEARQFEDFELDPTFCRLSRHGEVIRIEHIPLELLCLLVERSGQIVARDEIIERVWGKGVFIDSEHAINTAVRKIRRALGDDAEKPRFIVTIPGRGYRFVAPVLIPNGESNSGLGLSGARNIDEKGPPSTDGKSAPFLFTPCAPDENHPRQRRYWLAVLWSVVGLALIASAAVVRLSGSKPVTSGAQVSAQLATLQLPDQPSIAVLPFANLSGDPQQEYFSDGITDDLIADLSRVPKLFVIARTSSFTYKGKPAKAQTIGHKLGVKYLLEGSTRRAGDQVRINVRLVDAASGDELWSQRYNREMRDIFKLQDEIVRSLTKTIGLQLSVLEKGFILPQRTDNLEAYNYFLRGFEGLVIATPDALARAGKMFEQAIALDPSYADAYARLGQLIAIGYAWQLHSDPHALDRADKLARKAVLLDDSNSNAYAILAAVTELRNRLEEAIDEANRAITLDPNNPLAYLVLAEISGHAGNQRARLDYSQKGMRLDPKHPEFYLFEIGWACLGMKRYQKAADALKGAPPNYPFTHVGLIAAYAELGRQQDAKAEVVELHRVAPKFSPAEWRRRIPASWWDSADGQRLLDDLTNAGLK